MSARLARFALISLLAHALLIWLLPSAQLAPPAQTLVASEMMKVALLPAAPKPLAAAPRSAPRADQPVAQKAPPHLPRHPAAAEPPPAPPPVAAPLAPKVLAIADTTNSHATVPGEPSQPKLPAGAADKAKSSEGESSGAITQVAQFSAAYLNNPTPEIPFLARERCQSGRVVLRVLVSASGKPLQVTVAKESGCAIYDRVAQKTVKNQWRFEPARSGSVAVESEVEVPIRLNLVD
ncbi:energy transducer TonB [Chitinibacter fontanus]|uniref:Energy transducer TonB n=1 Tax=Chitinibacter fontanus TaxID=1737446 RepID=A0A7D5ZFD6_9NEIS|nr:energy transducer TonB [Chitinibacter fontanus]QLI80747.1 energy transducer TonB [Chitinibacter fontanus]